MAYSGPQSDPVRIHYPLETKGGEPDWQAVIIESNIDPLLDTDFRDRRSGVDTAYWRGGLIGFRTGDQPQIRRDQWIWVCRRFNARGGQEYWETPLHRYLSPRDNNIDDVVFWDRYEAAITHPGLLLHIAAQQAIKSMKEL